MVHIFSHIPSSSQPRLKGTDFTQEKLKKLREEGADYIRESPYYESNIEQAEYLILVLFLVGPGDVLPLIMYLCGVQKSRGFFNLNLGGWCDFGYVLEDCPSIAAALVFDQGLPLNDIVFGDPCERSLGLNVRYACPIQGKEYENCPDCKKTEGVGMADICDRYSERARL